jgi:hypothetical protein
MYMPRWPKKKEKKKVEKKAVKPQSVPEVKKAPVVKVERKKVVREVKLEKVLAAIKGSGSTIYCPRCGSPSNDNNACDFCRSEDTYERTIVKNLLKV